MSIFDPTLCELIYKWFCDEGGKVLDPFADGLFPITFPYMPNNKAYKVVDRIFATNGNPGEFDTVGILRVECPDGSVHLINKFYKEGKDDWIAINMEEFELRLQSYKDSLNNK